MRKQDQTIRPSVLVVLFMTAVFWAGEAKFDATASQADVRGTMEQVADYWLDNRLEETPDAGWDTSVLFSGLMALGSMSDQPIYSDRVLEWAEDLGWQIQYTIDPDHLLADDQMCGQTYFDLYLTDPDPVKIDSIKASVDEMLQDPTHDDWYWIDAIFMAAPVFSRFGWLTGDPAYYHKMYNLYRTTKIDMELFYPEDNLWIRDANYDFRTPNGKRIFWSRGNGWVIGALARILNFLPGTVTRPLDPGKDPISVTASSHESPNVPGNTLDEDLATRWSAEGIGASIVFDLGGTTTISKIGIAFFRGDQRQAYFSAAVSEDGEQWTTVIANGVSSGTSLDVQEFEFDNPDSGNSDTGITTRFVKITGNGNSQNAWNSYTEVQILAPIADEFVQLLVNMAESLKDRQRPDGFWNVSLDDALHYCGPETSGTALFTYAMAWGLNHRHLDEATYLPVVARAWNGLVRKAVHADGKLGFVQGAGESPWAPAEVSYETTSNFGVGVFLLAGSEVFKLQRIRETVAEASGYELGNPPEHTLDGDPATRWSAEGLGQWIQYDLGGVKHLDRIDIAFFRGDLRKAYFDVAVSENATDWETVIDDGESSGTTIASEPFAFPREVETRYVRITGFGNSQAGNDWNSYTEVFLPAWTHAERALASDYECPNAPQNAFDGNPDTRWSSEGDGEWIQYDLGRTATIDQVAIAFFRGNQRQAYFDVAFSTNREAWTTVILGGQSSGDSLDAEPFDVAPTEARYIRVIGHGNSQNAWNSITHIDLHTVP